MSVRKQEGRVLGSIALVVCLSISKSVFADSRVTLIRGIEGQQQYAQAAKGKSDEERAKLYESLIVDKYKECAENADGEVGYMPESRFAVPISDLDRLAETITAIEALGIDARVMKAAESAAELLSADRLTICLFAYHPEGPEIEFVEGAAEGVMGFAFFGQGKLWVEPLLLDNIDAEDWLAAVDYATVHELHHAIGDGRPGELIDEFTLLDAILAEGRADAFVEVMYPDVVLPWSSALSGTQESAIWNEMKENLDSADPEVIGSYLFGSEVTLPPKTRP